MRREKNLGFWITVLVVAGVGWLLTLAVWCCEIDPWGVATAIVPENIGPALAAAVLRHGCEGCVYAALILLTTGLIEEATDDEEPIRRRSSERDRE